MEPVTTRVPVLSLYNVLVIYLFLPIARREVALAMGLACTLVCMLLFIVIESVSVKFALCDLCGRTCVSLESSLVGDS